MSPIVKVLVARLAKRVAKRVKERAVTSVIGGAAGAAGLAAVVDPEVLELIPENLRGYAVLAVVVALCANRIVSEFREAVAEAKANAGD